MIIKYHSMKNNELVTVYTSLSDLLYLYDDYKNLPHHNGFTNFKKFIEFVYSYNN